MKKLRLILSFALVLISGNALAQIPGIGPTSFGAGNVNPIGHWVMSQYSASPSPNVPNIASTVPVSFDLFRAPRRLFNNQGYYAQGGVGLTIVDNAASAPDGSMQASTFNSAGAWALFYTGGGGTSVNSIPAGTYTAACTWQSLGSNQTLTFFDNALGGANQTSPNQTVTTTQARFTWTFTVVGTHKHQFGFQGLAAANFSAVDCELFAGSVDKDPLSSPIGLAGHMYLGGTAWDLQPQIGSNIVDWITGESLVQLTGVNKFSAVTVMAVLSQPSLPTNGGNQACVFSDINLGASNFGACSNFSSQTGALLLIDGQVSCGDCTYWNVTNAGYHVATWEYDGTYCKVYFDDVLVGTSAQGASTTDWGGNICASVTPTAISDLLTGGSAGSAAGIGGHYQIAEMYMWSRGLAQNEIDNFVDTLDAKYFASLGTKLQQAYIFAIGDSICAAADPGAGPNGTAWSYTGLFSKNANLFGQGSGIPALVGTNYCVSGSGIQLQFSALSYFQSLLPPASRLAGRQIILSMFFGSNDFGESTPGGLPNITAYVAAYNQFCTAYAASGFNFTFSSTVMDRTLPGGGPPGSTWAVNANAFNSQILASGNCRGVMNTSTDPYLGNPGSNVAANTVVYTTVGGSGVHPTAVGHADAETFLENEFIAVGFPVNQFAPAFRLYRGYANNAITYATMSGM